MIAVVMEVVLVVVVVFCDVSNGGGCVSGSDVGNGGSCGCDSDMVVVDVRVVVVFVMQCAVSDRQHNQLKKTIICSIAIYMKAICVSVIGQFMMTYGDKKMHVCT